MAGLRTQPCGNGFVGRYGVHARAGAAVARTKRAVYCIEGEHVDLAAIAERLGVARDTARDRLRREQGKDGAVTWEGLR